MQKYTRLIAYAITVTALIGTSAYAAAGGQPFNALWDAIANLEQQIATIESTPGPQGEPGLAGAPGPQGPQGPAGEGGLGKTYVESTEVIIEVGDRQEAYAWCEVGEKLVSGGFNVNAGLEIETSYPYPGTETVAGGWITKAYNGGDRSGVLRAFALCEKQ